MEKEIALKEGIILEDEWFYKKKSSGRGILLDGGILLEGEILLNEEIVPRPQIGRQTGSKLFTTFIQQTNQSYPLH